MLNGGAFRQMPDHKVISPLDSVFQFQWRMCYCRLFVCNKDTMSIASIDWRKHKK